jgi:hypothetical protein
VAEAVALGLAGTAAAVRYKEPAAAAAATGLAGTAEAGRYREAAVTEAPAAAVQSQGLTSSLAAGAAAIAPLFLREDFIRFLIFKNKQTLFLLLLIMLKNKILCLNNFAGRVCYSRRRGLHICAEGRKKTK